MHSESILFTIFLIFSGAAVVATLALYARQSMLVGYIVLGLVLGPWGLGVIQDASLIKDMAGVGIIFLLFLLGLSLEPRDLQRVFKEAMVVTIASSLVFAMLGFGIGVAFGFSLTESLLIGATLTFSSTILGLKLLPTSALHHQHMGEIIVSILLLQDIVAVLLLLLLEGLGKGGDPLTEIGKLAIYLPILFTLAILISRYVLTHLFAKFDQIREYIFLLTIGWCLGIAELATYLGLSHEIGAFIAGVSLAANPICRFIAESLKPLRDFFLVMFFFALGASFNLDIVQEVIVAAIALATVGVLAKPMIFKFLLRREKEKEHLASEIGVRLGQISEFSLLVAVVAVDAAVMSTKASYLVQTAVILTFVVSSYWIVFKYPTPIAVDERLRRD